MYASTNWVYPDWGEEEKLRRLKEAFPDDYPDEEEEDEEEELIEIREEEIESDQDIR